MPSFSIASANKEVKSVLDAPNSVGRESTLCILSINRKCEVSKLNVGVVLLIAICEISNHENEFDVNSRNISPSKITRYTVFRSRSTVSTRGIAIIIDLLYDFCVTIGTGKNERLYRYG